MSQVVVKQRNDVALRKVIDDMVASLGEALRSFVNQPITMSPDSDLQCVDLEEWRETWTESRSVIRGALDGMDEEHSMVLVLDTADAITLCGHLMLASSEVIESARQAMTLGSEYNDAFGELGNLLCSTISALIRQRIDPGSGLRIREFATVSSTSGSGSSLGEGARLVYGVNLQIGGHPAARMHLVMDYEVGQTWNDGIPLFVFYEGDADELDASDDQHGEHASTGDDVPLIYRRTKLSAFVTSLETAAMIRESCRKIGLEVQRHARTDVPNPAAHTGDIVLIEIPVGEERRFDWAKRLRQYHRDVPVVLLVHEPSRPRVVQGLLTRANVILAWPSKEAQLRAKIEPLIEIDSNDGGS